MTSDSTMRAPDWANWAFAQCGPKSAGIIVPLGASEVTLSVAMTTRSCLWKACRRVDSAYSVTPAKTEAIRITAMTIFVPRCMARLLKSQPAIGFLVGRESVGGWSAFLQEVTLE